MSAVGGRVASGGGEGGGGGVGGSGREVCSEEGWRVFSKCGLMGNGATLEAGEGALGDASVGGGGVLEGGGGGDRGFRLS